MPPPMTTTSGLVEVTDAGRRSWLTPMSSRGGRGHHPGCLVGPESAVHLVTDPPPEGADRLGLGVACRPSLLKIRAAAVVDPQLGDGDPVERDVELAVAAPAQAEAGGVARPDRDGRRAVVAGERRLGAEAADAGRLADHLGGSERPQPGRASRVGASAATRVSISRSSGADASSTRDPTDEVAGDAGGRSARPARRASRSARTAARSSERGAGSSMAESSRCQRRRWICRVRSADEVLTMVDEQAQLALRAVERGDRQVGLAEGRLGDRIARRSGRSCRVPGPSGGHRP